MNNLFLSQEMIKFTKQNSRKLNEVLKNLFLKIDKLTMK